MDGMQQPESEAVSMSTRTNSPDVRVSEGDLPMDDARQEGSVLPIDAHSLLAVGDVVLYETASQEKDWRWSIGVVKSIFVRMMDTSGQILPPGHSSIDVAISDVTCMGEAREEENLGLIHHRFRGHKPTKGIPAAGEESLDVTASCEILRATVSLDSFQVDLHDPSRSASRSVLDGLETEKSNGWLFRNRGEEALRTSKDPSMLLEVVGKEVLATSWAKWEALFTTPAEELPPITRQTVVFMLKLLGLLPLEGPDFTAESHWKEAAVCALSHDVARVMNCVGARSREGRLAGAPAMLARVAWVRANGGEVASFTYAHALHASPLAARLYLWITHCLRAVEGRRSIGATEAEGPRSDHVVSHSDVVSLWRCTAAPHRLPQACVFARLRRVFPGSSFLLVPRTDLPAMRRAAQARHERWRLPLETSAGKLLPRTTSYPVSTQVVSSEKPSPSRTERVSSPPLHFLGEARGAAVVEDGGSPSLSGGEAWRRLMEDEKQGRRRVCLEASEALIEHLSHTLSRVDVLYRLCYSLSFGETIEDLRYQLRRRRDMHLTVAYKLQIAINAVVDAPGGLSSCATLLVRRIEDVLEDILSDGCEQDQPGVEVLPPELRQSLWSWWAGRRGGEGASVPALIEMHQTPGHDGDDDDDDTSRPPPAGGQAEEVETRANSSEIPETSSETQAMPPARGNGRGAPGGNVAVYLQQLQEAHRMRIERLQQAIQSDVAMLASLDEQIENLTRMTDSVPAADGHRAPPSENPGAPSSASPWRNGELGLDKRVGLLRQQKEVTELEYHERLREITTLNNMTRLAAHALEATCGTATRDGPSLEPAFSLSPPVPRYPASGCP